MTRPRSGWPSVVNADPFASGRPASLMPGRKQGWPRGVNTSADPAENLLAQAVGWWDAAWYTPGDRFLRNRGVAGELLDMRLGSSLAANSNDPLFLAPGAYGYVALPGIAGNTISCTAPASATKYVAYNIDGTTTTAAATGGAAFAFSTAGNWRLIELQDVSNVVVAAFDSDALTSGAATAQTDAYSVAWAINRATSGRKTVAMPAAGRGGRAVMLFGTDDYLSVTGITDRQLHQFVSLGNNLLDSDYRCPDKYTVVGVARVWPDSARPWVFFNQGTQQAGVFVGTGGGHAFGIDLGTGATCTPVLYLRATNATYTAGPTASMGSLVIAAGVVQRDNQREAKVVYTNGVAGVTNTTNHGPGTPTITSSNASYVGFTPNGSAGFPAEFISLSYFRRALTAAEITLLSNYYSARNY